MPPAIDLSLEELRVYKPQLTKRQDFDSFWEETIEESKKQPINGELVPFEFAIKEVKAYNAYFDGFKSGRINGWYIIPANASKNNKVPILIVYHGYSCYNGYVSEYMNWLIQGYAVLVMNTRGQGMKAPDNAIYSNGGIKGWMTRGIMDKYEYYYRNAYMDCVRAIDFACEREEIDTGRIGICGVSQGGGLTLATAALDKRPKFAMAQYPYLCHFKRALEMYSGSPYEEFFEYFKTYDPEMKTEEKVFETLSYFDGMNLATSITCPLLMCIGLRDTVCPPSTTFAAYNHLSCQKEMKIYPCHAHEYIPDYNEYTLGYARRFMKKDKGD